MEIPGSSPQDERLPTVSVVIPTRARSEVVRRAVHSALTQTLRDIEVIVVVDGVDPATVAVLKEIPDPRLVIAPLPQPVGAAEARNIAVQRARGAWIAFLDDDDEWLPEKLERQLTCALEEVTGSMPVVCSAYIARSGDRDILFGRRAPLPHEPISEYMFCRHGISYGENAVATSVLFVAKSLLISVPFDPQLKRHQDWDWALRALQVAGTSLRYIAEPLSIYHMPAGAPRLSAHDDWRYSLHWCQDRRPLLTPKAFSFFIVTECLTRARQAKASLGEIASLLQLYWRSGQPTWRSARLALFYLLIPLRARTLLSHLGRPATRRNIPAVD